MCYYAVIEQGAHAMSEYEMGDDYVRSCNAGAAKLARENEAAYEAHIAAQPKKFDKVIIVKSRKNKVGTVGTMFWMREEVQSFNYGRNGRRVTRIGIKTFESETPVWEYLHNVKKVEE